MWVKVSVPFKFLLMAISFVVTKCFNISPGNFETLIEQTKSKSIVYVGSHSDTFQFDMSQLASKFQVQIADKDKLILDDEDKNNLLVLDIENPDVASDILSNVDATSFVRNVWFIFGQNSTQASQTMRLQFKKGKLPKKKLGVHSQLFFVHHGLNGPSNVTTVIGQAYMIPKLKVGTRIFGGNVKFEFSR